MFTSAWSLAFYVLLSQAFQTSNTFLVKNKLPQVPSKSSMLSGYGEERTFTPCPFFTNLHWSPFDLSSPPLGILHCFWRSTSLSTLHPTLSSSPLPSSSPFPPHPCPLRPPLHPLLVSNDHSWDCARWMKIILAWIFTARICCSRAEDIYQYLSAQNILSRKLLEVWSDNSLGGVFGTKVNPSCHLNWLRLKNRD